MRGLKRGLLVAALAVTGVVGMSSAAQAAGLYTTSSSGTLVSVGATAVATSADVDLNEAFFNFTINHCDSSSMTAEVTDNSGDISADITGTTFSSCDQATTANGLPWVLAIDSSDTTNPYEGDVNGVSVSFGGDTYSGNITYGGSWNNNSTSAASINLQNAGALSNGTFTGEVDGDWTVQGTAGAWTIQ